MTNSTPDTKAMRAELEAAGWVFTRYSRRRGKWVPCKGKESRRLATAIAYHWREQNKARTELRLWDLYG